MKKQILYTICLVFLLAACKKEAGPGGTSSIKGKVYAKYYNKNFTILADSAYAPDLDVYIIYGNEFSYGKRVRTSFDGSYEFKYLRPGSYKIFTYSKDSTGSYKNQANSYSPDVAVVKLVDITKNKQVKEVPDINVVQ